MKSIPRHIRPGLTKRGSKTSSYTAPSEGTELNIKLVQNTVHSYIKRRGGHLATALMNLWSVKPFLIFFKTAQVNKEQWDLMPHINTQALPLKQSINLYYN